MGEVTIRVVPKSRKNKTTVRSAAAKQQPAEPGHTQSKRVSAAQWVSGHNLQPTRLVSVQELSHSTRDSQRPVTVAHSNLNTAMVGNIPEQQNASCYYTEVKH